VVVMMTIVFTYLYHYIPWILSMSKDLLDIESVNIKYICMPTKHMAVYNR
jgi:hypothetical protein